MESAYLEFAEGKKQEIRDKIKAIGDPLQDARRRIAKPYIYALIGQFPNAPVEELIIQAHQDLLKLNPSYEKLTELLEKINELSSNQFQGLVARIQKLNSEIPFRNLF